MLTLRMPAAVPGNTGHKPDSSSAIGTVAMAESVRAEVTPENRRTVHGQLDDHIVTPDDTQRCE
ncbi:hypothetical protein [uncultured Methanospirillum sp.]|uniref:hypothetical protein n=1 Tax=uncultured Methanospirillum sp. TaxID=262503 RepID=UPI0029C8A8DF|nr:hypothetical protein [uncultured Methanospirillum sp.]